jgi:hypothetical protein
LVSRKVKNCWPRHSQAGDPTARRPSKRSLVEREILGSPTTVEEMLDPRESGSKDAFVESILEVRKAVGCGEKISLPSLLARHVE